MPSPFSQQLLTWFETEKRDLPWKATHDPYKIWISEIILQQTRVAQGLPYYERFIKKFPTVKKLADAPLDEVLKMWEGLGYYSRARNLHHTALIIRDQYKGVFPKNYEEILALKGIGSYTAAAIASFAFNLPYPVLDGNVKRVVARFLGMREAIDLPATQKAMMVWLNQALPPKQSADFNQAMLDLGATVCTPQNPKCDACPVSSFCVAKKEDLQSLLPVKAKTIIKRDRYFHFFVVVDPSGACLLEQRKEKDIWQGLYQFPLLETTTPKKLTKKEITSRLNDMGLELDPLADYSYFEPEKPHILTHQSIYTKFYTIKIAKNTLKISNKHIFFVDSRKLTNFAFPRVLHGVLNNILS